jgi:DNA-binding MarR family transcriptional regulator
MRSGSARIRRTLDHRTTYRFSMISKRLTDCLSNAFQSKFDLSINGWRVLSVVERFGPLAAFEVGRYVSLDPDKVTRTLNSLVKYKLLVRREDANDRRRISLSLSPKGKQVYEEIDKVRVALEYEFLGVLTPSELTTFYAVMDKLDEKANELFDRRKQLIGQIQARRPKETQTGYVRRSSRPK